MRAEQLFNIMSKLDPKKRIKFQNYKGIDETVAVNAILEQGNCYILIWACHPYIIKNELKEGQRLVWYNPNTHNRDVVKNYFPDYENL